MANDAQVLVDHATLSEFFKQYKPLIERMRAIPRLDNAGPGLAQFRSLVTRLDLDPIVLGLEQCSLEDAGSASAEPVVVRCPSVRVKSVQEETGSASTKPIVAQCPSVFVKSVSEDTGSASTKPIVAQCPSVFVTNRGAPVSTSNSIQLNVDGGIAHTGTTQSYQLPDSYKLFVGNLPRDISEHELKVFFSQYGNVVQVVINQKKNSRKKAFFGIVTFDNEDTIEKMMSLKMRAPILLRGEYPLQVERKRSTTRRGARGRGRSNNNY